MPGRVRLSHGTLASLVLCCAGLALAACGDSTPAAVTDANGATVTTRTYDFTTVLDSFSFPPPYDSSTQAYQYDAGDCSSGTKYCLIRRSNTLGAFSGTLVSVDSAGTAANPLQAHLTAAASGEFCTTIDVDKGCTAVGPATTLTYTGTEGGDSTVLLRNVEYAPGGPAIQFKNVRVTADSLYGDVEWMQLIYVNPPNFSGHFVARLRK